MKKISIIIISFLFLQMDCQASYGEEYVLISHPNCPVEQLTKQDVKRIFLGKMKKWPDGSSIDLVVNNNESIYPKFTTEILQRSPSQFRSYWRTILFSGRSVMPVFVESDDEAKAYVNNNQNTLSFIRKSNYDNATKMITVTQ